MKPNVELLGVVALVSLGGRAGGPALELELELVLGRGFRAGGRNDLDGTGEGGRPLCRKEGGTGRAFEKRDFPLWGVGRLAVSMLWDSPGFWGYRMCYGRRRDGGMTRE